MMKNNQFGVGLGSLDKGNLKHYHSVTPPTKRLTFSALLAMLIKTFNIH